MTRRLRPARALYALLLILSLLAVPGVPQPAEARIDNNQPTSPVASIVDGIQPGSDFGQANHVSPRFAGANFSSAWTRGSYNFDTATVDGDAPRAFPAIIGFGDGKPDRPGEPGHTTIASLGNDGTEPGDIGLGTVYGLAFSSGSNPAAPAFTRRPRLFAGAYHKRVTRYADGGPGAIYVIDQQTNSEQLYVQVPNVVPGPSNPQSGPAGFPNTPGDGSSGSWPSQAEGVGYSPAMGGVHSTEHDAVGRPWVGRVSLGDVEMEPGERFLFALNLRNRTIYFYDTWSATPQSTQGTLAIPANVAACPAGDDNFRPFALAFQNTPAGLLGYVGYVCSAQTTPDTRDNLRAGVLRWNSSLAWSRVLDFPLSAFDGQRAEGVRTQWMPWSDSLFVPLPGTNAVATRQQPMLTDIEFGENGSLILGLRSRTGDMGTTLRFAQDATIGMGDLLLAPPNGSGGWNAPSSSGAEHFSDTDGWNGHQETGWGGLAYVPGTAAGAYGGELVTTGLAPYRAGSGGAYWFDITGGQWTNREELQGDGQVASFAKASGLGDVELLAVWRAIGNRVWRDSNGNGIQDGGEADIPGVRLQLLDTSNTVLATVTTGTVTGAGDLWRFYVAPFQQYRVRLDPAMFTAGQPLAGLTISPADQGGNDALDSDADSSGVIAIPPGPRSDVNLSYDIGVGSRTNIRVSKTGPVTARINDALQYTVVVTNDGPLTAQNVQVEDTLPAGFDYLDAIPATPAPTSRNGNILRWSLGDVTPGTSITITIPGRISASSGSITNRVTISTTTNGDDPGDNTSTHTTTIDTTPRVLPDVWVRKSAPLYAISGTEFEYTITYGNQGPVTAAQVQIQDLLPQTNLFPLVTFVSSTPAPNGLFQGPNPVAYSWNLGDLAPGQTGTIRVRVRVNENRVPPRSFFPENTLINNVYISTLTSFEDQSNNQDQTTTYVGIPDVAVRKSGPVTALAGDEIEYTLSYRNARYDFFGNPDAFAENVQVVDTLPPGTTFVNASPAPASVSGNTVTWNLGTLQPMPLNDPWPVITLRVRIAPSVPRDTVLTNRAVISTTTPGERSSSDNSTSFDTTIVAPNVRVTKTGAPRATAGEEFAYTLSYDNAGNAPAANVRVVDTLPANVTLVRATPAPTTRDGNTLTWELGALPVGASGSIALVVEASPTLANGTTLTNGVAISTTTSGDEPGDNTSSWDTLVQRADVTITKSSPTTFPVVPGTTVTYHLDYSNAGPAAARNVVITDAVPSQLTGVSWSCASGCTGSGTGNSISVAVGLLEPGATGRIVVTGTAVTSLARENFVNTARISTSTPETSTTNNESSVPGAVWTSDLIIIKDASPQVVAGRTFTATLTIRNQGPAPAGTVQVQDTLPAGVTLVSATPAAASQSGQTVTWNLGTVADGATTVIALVLRADPGLNGGTSLVNVAAVSGSADRDPTNNRDDSTTLTQRQADIRIDKSGPARVVAGAQISYTLAWGNDGPSTSRAVTVQDTLPPGVTLVSATPAPATNSNGVLTWTLGDVAAGASGTITVVVATNPVQATPTLTLLNRVAITDGGTGTNTNDDPDPGDNTDDTSTIVETSDVLVVKDMPAVAVPGRDFDATLRVENRGPAAAQAVTVQDILPAGVTLVSATPAATGAGPSWSLGTLNAGQVMTITLRLRAPANTPAGTVVNRATVDTSTPDRDRSNNESQDSSTLRPEADLSVVKDGLTGPVLSGSSVTYSLTWRNAGPSLAAGVVVTDTVPAGFTFQSATPAPATNSNGVLTWNLGDLDPGASGTITLRGTLATTQASETIVNVAGITSTTDDPTSSNNRDDHPVQVQTVDLAIEKLGTPLRASAGEVYTYTLTIRNAGPATATTVQVQDTLPAVMTFLSATPAPATQNGQALTWNLGTLTPNATQTITLRVRVAPSARGRIENTGTVNSPEPDRNPTNNTSTHTTNTDGIADLSIVKDGTPGPIRSGSVVTYTLRYRNDGPSLATSTVLTDTLPAGFTLDSATPASTTNSNGVLTWALGDLAPNASGVITLRGTLVGEGVTTTRVNVATIGSTTDDPRISTNRDDHPIEVQKPDLSVTKTNGVTSAQPGELLTYRIVVRNGGRAVATGITVTETPPQGAVQSGDGWQAGAGGTFTQAIAQLAAGQVMTLTMRVQLPNPLPAGMERALNVVTVTDDGSGGDDPTPDDNSSRDDDPLVWGTVGDLIWIDRNRNASPDAGEPGLANVPLELLDPDTRAVLGRVTTDVNGGYRFTGLRLGRYLLRIEPSALSGPLATYAITTQPTPVTALTQTQREDMTLDIGLYAPPTAIDLAYLRAERQADGTVLVRWGTLAERDTARFVVKRTRTPELTGDAVSVGELPSVGSAGGDYRIVDTSAPPAAAGTLYYWLVEEETDGQRNVYGPASTAGTTSGSNRIYLPLLRR